jgi:high-affinity K+ transport system ATPase subunit B
MLLLPLHGAFLIISLAILGLKVVALIDAATRPPAAFVAMDKQTKQFWLIVLVVALLVTPLGFLSIIGLVAAIVYLVDVRPAVRSGSR